MTPTVNSPAGLRQWAVDPATPAAARPPARETGNTSLGQSDFLRLLTAQLENQDPTEPLKNEDFVAQMAQFSTVSGIEGIAASLDALAERLEPSRIATATALIGRSVLVPGGAATRDASGGVSGAIDLPAAADDVILTIADAAGRPLRQLSLGPQPSGLVGFAWDGRDAQGAAVPGGPGGRVQIAAHAVRAGAHAATATAIYDRVERVDIAGGEPSLGLAGGGTAALAAVRQVRAN